MMNLFPLTITLDIGLSITLYADGTFTGNPGSVEVFLSLATLARVPPDPLIAGAVVLWLMLRAMQDDRKIGRAPR